MVHVHTWRTHDCELLSIALRKKRHSLNKKFWARSIWLTECDLIAQRVVLCKWRVTQPWVIAQMQFTSRSANESLSCRTYVAPECERHSRDEKAHLRGLYFSSSEKYYCSKHVIFFSSVPCIISRKILSKYPMSEKRLREKSLSRTVSNASVAYSTFDCISDFIKKWNFIGRNAISRKEQFVYNIPPKKGIRSSIWRISSDRVGVKNRVRT